MVRQRIVVVGTGTGIGKTHLSVALLRALGARGLMVAGLKPVESGVGDGISDTERLAGAATFHVKQDPPYRLKAPLSPHLAAPLEGQSVRLQPIVRWVDSVESEWQVVETAGALLSPLAPGVTNLDLAAALDPTSLVLVAPDRLGVLHDVTAALFAMHHLAPHFPDPVVALLAPGAPDASTGTNAWELLVLGIATRVVTFPRGPAEGAESQIAASALAELLFPSAPLDPRA